MHKRFGSKRFGWIAILVVAMGFSAGLYQNCMKQKVSIKFSQSHSSETAKSPMPVETPSPSPSPLVSPSPSPANSPQISPSPSPSPRFSPSPSPSRSPSPSPSRSPSPSPSPTPPSVTGKNLLAQLPYQVGATHVAGDYRFTNQNFLIEGAQKLIDLRAPSIFVHLMPGIQGTYPANDGPAWPGNLTNLTQLADSAPFRQLFTMNFKVFVITALTYSVGGNMLPSPSRPADWATREENEIYNFARYLFTQYRGSNKIFVLKNWETDWVALHGANTGNDITTDDANALVEWFNARQRGVTRARNEAMGGDRVGVFFAAEVNRVLDVPDRGKKRVIDQVIPRTNVDMVSYSSYDALRDTQSNTESELRRAFQFIYSKLADSYGLGTKRLFISEYGSPEMEMGSTKVQARTKGAIEASRTSGLWGSYIWQLYDNECRDSSGADLPSVAYGPGDPLRPTNSLCRGFWIDKPDGTKGASYNILRTYWP